MTSPSTTASQVGGDPGAEGPAEREPPYQVGDRVLVVDVERAGYVRTPRYVRGSRGVVTAVHGKYLDPESLGDGGDGRPARWLFEVALPSRELWPGSGRGAEHVVYVDIYDHWLAPPGAAS